MQNIAVVSPFLRSDFQKIMVCKRIIAGIKFEVGRILQLKARHTFRAKLFLKGPKLFAFFKALSSSTLDHVGQIFHFLSCRSSSILDMSSSIFVLMVVQEKFVRVER